VAFIEALISGRQVHLECAGLFQTLFVVTGSCQGLEVSLDADSVPFGAVVQNSSSSRQIIMNNTGDVGARFSTDDKFYNLPSVARIRIFNV
jgi:hydrocephalus-inducing protein